MATVSPQPRSRARFPPEIGVQLNYINIPTVSSDLLIAEREILARVAAGGSLSEVMRDIILMVERPTDGEMLASILILSDDGKRLLKGAAPSLPAEYNAAIHGIAVGYGVGSCGTAAATGEPVIVTDIATIAPIRRGSLQARRHETVSKGAAGLERRPRYPHNRKRAAPSRGVAPSERCGRDRCP
jgi:hypothetical protein